MMEISELGVNKRIIRTLAEMGIATVDDIQNHLRKAKIGDIPGIGRNAANELKNALESVGVQVPIESTSERLPPPDDDQLADIVIADIQQDYRYFYSAWHKYENGLWNAVKNIFPHVIKVLRANRARGIRPSKGRVGSVEFFVKTALEIEDDLIVDDYPQYFNCQNGLFNLETMQLEPHCKDVIVTAQAGFPYDAKAHAPTFKNWLADMLVKPNSTDTDWSLVSLVQEMIGYCLTADTSHRVSFWIVGASGTGKSTLVNLMVQMMRSYHKTIDLNQLALNRFLLAAIAGKRLVTSVEASAGVKLDDGVYKTLVSDDMLLADVKNRDPIEFIPQCKVVWAMNNLPYVGDRSGAVDARILIVPMTRVIHREHWDLRLDEKLSAELPGIFNFALEGLRRLRSQGAFTRVGQSEQMSDEYRRMQDIYAAFLEDESWCILGDGRTSAGTLYSTFCLWCQETGIRNFASKLSIAREWERLGLIRVNSMGRYYDGVQLKKTS
jgi:P4 family phage/plasmid primase-like protien